LSDAREYVKRRRRSRIVVEAHRILHVRCYGSNRKSAGPRALEDQVESGRSIGLTEVDALRWSHWTRERVHQTSEHQRVGRIAQFERVGEPLLETRLEIERFRNELVRLIVGARSTRGLREKSALTIRQRGRA